MTHEDREYYLRKRIRSLRRAVEESADFHLLTHEQWQEKFGVMICPRELGLKMRDALQSDDEFMDKYTG